tara:strand:+ start:1450 stop:2202 length:753 start_codon:yes stop_codon:yes gene_type:complete
MVHKDPIPVHDSIRLYSNILGEERRINVWKPKTYNTEKQELTVLYMPDGGIHEDFPHIANTLEKLIADKSISPILLVGIENTVRGRDLTGFSNTDYDKQFCPQSDGAKNFRAFIQSELKPHIDSTYRTTSESGIIGESLAGLFVMETFLKHPNSFDFYIAFDPSLWWNNHYLNRKADSLLKVFPNSKKTLWFAGSSVEDISIHTRNLNQSLQQHSPTQITWKYSDETEEKHHTIFRATKEKAITWTLTNL